MLERYKILTVTHKRINLQNISDFVVKAADNIALRVKLEEIKKQFGFRELIYLSTCNRVMYLFDSDRSLDLAFATEFFQHINPMLSYETLDSIEEVVSRYEGMAALEHLFRVSASIDSMVIGERQILGQLREAYDQCRQWGLTGDTLRLAMDQAVQAAKTVYSQTRIGDKPVSMASLAVQKMMRYHLHKDARILVVGAGQTNNIVAKFLAKHHFTNVTVFNRTFAKAQELADLFENGRALPFSEIDSYSEGFDAMVVCTGATEAVITSERYQNLLAGDTATKVVIDLSIPHNVAPAVTQAFPMHYVEIEGLRTLAKENLAFREQEVKRAKTLLAGFIEAFPTLFRQRQLEIAMRSVPEEIKAVKDKAINEVFRKEVDTLDETTRELVERMLAYMEKKCIGIPMKAAREISL